jgi:alkanesulfonate monooxygenase SsuD/methylene tetrahydromethanopterin reductase-like flavin-dependent oxidoreductase (luciferase family)
VRFGTFHLYSVPPWTSSRQVVEDHFQYYGEAERQGFHEVWLAEHSSRPYGFVGNSVTVAASIAAATERIRIGTAVTRLPLHHPLRLAEDLAYVHVVSGGRLDWGVGKGYDLLEFATSGINFDQREERWQETFDAVRQMWRTGRTEFKGRFYDLADGELLPNPGADTIPTYVMVSGSEASVQWAARQLLPIAIGSGPGWDDIPSRLELYAETAERAGHPRARVEQTIAETWQLRQVYVADTTPEAIDEYRDGLMWYMDSLANRAMFGFARERQSYEYYIEHAAITVGSPEKVVEDLLAYNEQTCVNNVICWFSIGGQPRERVLHALHLFGTEVMPRLAKVERDALNPRPLTVSS